MPPCASRSRRIPTNTVRGLARAVELLREISPGIRLVGGLADRMRPIVPPPPILAASRLADAQTGPRSAPPGEVRDILERLEFGVSDARPAPVLRDSALLARHQRHLHDGRPGGRSRPHDRLRFHRGPPRPRFWPRFRPPIPERAFHQDVRVAAGRPGFHRGLQLFVRERRSGAGVRIRSGGSRDRGQSHRVGPDACCGRRCCPESGRTSSRTPSTRTISACSKSAARFTNAAEGLPDEIPHLAAAIYSKDGDGRAGLFEMKRVALCLMPEATVRPVDARTYEHPARAVEMVWRETVVGRLFELHPRMVEGRTAILDLDLRLIQSLAPRETTVCAHPAVSVERFRSFGGRRRARTGGRFERTVGGIRRTDAAIDRVCAGVLGAAAAGGTEERLVPADPRIARSERFRRKKSAGFAPRSSKGCRRWGTN